MGPTRHRAWQTASSPWCSTSRGFPRMLAEPSDREKIAAITCPLELEGFRFGLNFQGRMTPELDNLLKMRAAEIARMK